MPVWKGACLGAASCILHLLGKAAGSPSVLEVRKPRQEQGQESRLASSAQCLREGAEPVAGRKGPQSLTPSPLRPAAAAPRT